MSPPRSRRTMLVGAAVYVAYWLFAAFVLRSILPPNSLEGPRNPADMWLFDFVELATYYAPIVLGVVGGFAIGRWWAVGLGLIPFLLAVLGAPGLVSCFDALGGGCAMFSFLGSGWETGGMFVHTVEWFLIPSVIQLASGVLLAWVVFAWSSRGRMASN